MLWRLTLVVWGQKTPVALSLQWVFSLPMEPEASSVRSSNALRLLYKDLYSVCFIPTTHISATATDTINYNFTSVLDQVDLQKLTTRQTHLSSQILSGGHLCSTNGLNSQGDPPLLFCPLTKHQGDPHLHSQSTPWHSQLPITRWQRGGLALLLCLADALLIADQRRPLATSDQPLKWTHRQKTGWRIALRQGDRQIQLLGSNWLPLLVNFSKRAKKQEVDMCLYIQRH